MAAKIKKQEKFGFDVKGRGEHAGTYGPFDTKEAASKTAKSLVAGGLTVSDVRVLWTVSTARSIAAALAPKPEAKPATPETKAS